MISLKTMFGILLASQLIVAPYASGYHHGQDGPTREEVRAEKEKCRGQYNMVYHIQLTRILSGDDWETFQDRVAGGYNAGGPLGAAQTPEAIKIKDRFYTELLGFAEYIYSTFDRGWAPDKVANLALESCMVLADEKLFYGDDGVLEYDI